MYVNISTAAQYAPIIHNFGLMNQMLLCKTLDLGLLEDARQLQRIDYKLRWLLNYKSGEFNFVAAIASGKTLFVGEGNLSFALSLAQNSRITPGRLVASTFEDKNELSEEALANADQLKTLGVTVLHGVDATALQDSLGSWAFDTIVFQFPHAGVRGEVEGRNPNFILIRDFLLSAVSQLRSGGKVIISAVDTPHYRGAFQFEEAAQLTGFKAPEVHRFDPSKFPEYEHLTTQQESDVLENHDAFSSWVFKLVG